MSEVPEAFLDHQLYNAVRSLALPIDQCNKDCKKFNARLNQLVDDAQDGVISQDAALDEARQIGDITQHCDGIELRSHGAIAICGLKNN